MAWTGLFEDIEGGRTEQTQAFSVIIIDSHFGLYPLLLLPLLSLLLVLRTFIFGFPFPYRINGELPFTSGIVVFMVVVGTLSSIST